MKTTKRIAALIALAIMPSALFSQEVKPLAIGDGTSVRLVLDENVSSESAHTGDVIRFDVVEDVTVDGVVVIARGAKAWATVTKADPKKRMGRAGKIDMNVDKVELVDGEKILLRAVKDAKGGGHQGGIATGMVLTTLVFWPAAPLFLLKHGKEADIPEGTQITAFTQGDVSLDAAKFAAAAAAAVVPAVAPVAIAKPAPQGMMVISSTSEQDAQPMNAGSIASAAHTESLGEYARRMKAERAAQKPE